VCVGVGGAVAVVRRRREPRRETVQVYDLNPNSITLNPEP